MPYWVGMLPPVAEALCMWVLCCSLDEELFHVETFLKAIVEKQIHPMCIVEHHLRCLWLNVYINVDLRRDFGRSMFENNRDFAKQFTVKHKRV